MPYTPISLRGFFIPDGGPGRFIQCGAHRYPCSGSVDVPLVENVLETSDRVQIRRLYARNPRVSRIFQRYIVYYAASDTEISADGERIWHGDLIVFRGGVRGELGLVNMRGRDDIMARFIARRVVLEDGYAVPHWMSE